MENKVAYLCDGLVPKCSGRVGCFKCRSPDFGENNTCYHTIDPVHAKYGLTLYPEVWIGSRFKIIHTEDNSSTAPKYFEEWDEDKITALCESGNIYLMPNESIRSIWILRHAIK